MGQVETSKGIGGWRNRRWDGRMRSEEGTLEGYGRRREQRRGKERRSLNLRAGTQKFHNSACTST
jgi:hypothetical protein